MMEYSKGKRSMVYLRKFKGKKVIAKKEKFKGVAHKEAYWLRILNKEGIGPKLIDEGKDFVVMEPIEGKRILEWMEKADKKKIKKVIKDTIKQCKKMDRLKINKKEMHHPWKHIIIRRNKPVMIDFERCKKTLRPKNLNQFRQFLKSYKVKKILEGKRA